MNYHYEALLDFFGADPEELPGEPPDGELRWPDALSDKHALALRLHRSLVEIEGGEAASKAEAGRYAARAATFARRAAWIKQQLVALALADGTPNPKGGSKLACGPTLTLSAVRTESIEIVDAKAIPDEFRRLIPARMEPDKAAIKEHLHLTGEVVAGTAPKYNHHLRIS